MGRTVTEPSSLRFAPFGRCALMMSAVLALAACGDSSLEVPANPPPPPEPPMVPAPPPSMVVLGAGPAAGFQGYGISAATQGVSYAALLAGATGYTLRLPLVADPGCPAPSVLPGIAPPAPGACALQAATGAFHNVAIPGARLVDALDKTAAPSQLETLILGAATQVSAASSQSPQFAIVDLGSEDALQPALSGTLGTGAAEPDLLSAAAFQARYDRLVSALAGIGSLQRVVLVGVADPVRFVPILQPGAYYFLARDPATNMFQGKPVNANCSPVTALGTPNPLAANLLPMTVAASAQPDINCDPAVAGTRIVDSVERPTVTTRVAQYNAIIQAAATARGWAFVDPNPLLETLRTEKTGARYQAMRVCQDLPTATTAAQFQAAVLNSCPVTGATAAPGFFGSYFSTDGIYPATQGHALLAGRMAAAVNAVYGTTLPTTY
ncbi:MAG TPA: hypothetical protein VNB23_11665 [Ramlibacter sp.]|nr:hypothetical protein [Ramlibacter sp.]